MTTLLPGTRVRARGITWDVVHVEQAGDQHRVRLRCSEGALRGREFDLLAPFEAIEPVALAFEPARAGRLRDWRLYHDAFLLEQMLGPGALLAAQPGRLDIAPYQLVPVQRALQQGRPRLLLADGVGLGKTIQAGLVLAELIARRRAHRILIVSPAGPLLDQWDLELRQRFGLRFERVKRWDDLQEVRRSLELGSNPFDRLSFCLTSYTFARQEKVLQDLERSTWDVVVIDEAHHAFRMGAAGDQDDKITRRLAEVLARRSDGLLLLTATPHDGFDAHFASLVELLDPSLVDGRGALRGDAYRRYVIRRLKRHVKHPVTGEPLFRERRVHPRAIELDAASHPRVVELHRALVELVVPRLRSAVRRRSYGDVLALVALLKRSVSTLRAAASTLGVVRDRYQRMLEQGAEAKEARQERLRTLREYRQRLVRFGALSQDEEEDQSRLEAEDVASELFQGIDDLDEAIGAERRQGRRDSDRLHRSEELRAELSRLVHLATEAQAQDPKLEHLLRELVAIRVAEPRANVLVFTEYTDSQAAVVEVLTAAVRARHLEGEVLAIRGEDDDAARTKATGRFTSEDGLILVSTDASAEGLNLHARCHHLVHLELPYNPNRLEQRNGRIDRYGQLQDPEVRYLYLSGTFEERLLFRLFAKVERQRARLSFVPDTLGVVISSDAGVAGLLEGLVRDEQGLFGAPPSSIEIAEPEQDDPDSTPYRELSAEIDRALHGFEKSARTADWLGDAGLSVEDALLRDAVQAREAGERLVHVDLGTFVRAAVEADGGHAAVGREGTLELSLPPAWTFGLEELPGYDANARLLRLTKDKAKDKDEAGRALGFLGRAHPIVRRALDRVQALQFGAGDAPLDRRVSAARSATDAPGLLYTFLARVTTDGGPILERVIAVHVTAGEAPRAIVEPGVWLDLAQDPVPTAGVWQRHFASSSLSSRDDAAQFAARAFEPLAEEARAAHARSIDRERRELDGWLVQRALELCGERTVAQAELFSAPGEGVESAPWQVQSDPAERLAAFALDGSVPIPRRREAEGVLRLEKARRADVERRARPRVEPPASLGMLMLVPREGG